MGNFRHACRLMESVGSVLLAGVVVVTFLEFIVF